MDPTTATPTETVDSAKSANLTLAQLGERMAKGRKAASKPKPAPAETPPTATTATSSEQAEAEEAKPVLSQPEDDSAALAAEATAEGTTETETTEEATEAEAEATPRAIRDLQRRVGKVTEQRNEAREEIAALKAQLEELKAQLPKPKETHPADASFEGDRSVAEIASELDGLDAFLAWADENPDGGSFTEADGKRFELTGEEVRSYRRKCEAQAIRLNARREARLETLRAEFDAKRRAAHSEAVKLYPWIEQKGSPEFQEALAVIRENPAVLQRADFELIVARQVAGARLEREALKKVKPTAARPAAGRPVTPVVTFSPSAAPKGEGKMAATVSAAEKAFREGGGRESDLSKLLAQKRLARLEAAKG